MLNSRKRLRAFAGKEAFKPRLNTGGTARTKANRKAARKTVLRSGQACVAPPPGSHVFLRERTYWKAASGAAAPGQPSAVAAGSAASLAWGTVIGRKERVSTDQR